MGHAAHNGDQHSEEAFWTDKSDQKKMSVAMNNVNRLEQGLFRTNGALSHCDNFGTAIIQNDPSIDKLIAELHSAQSDEAADTAMGKVKDALKTSRDLQQSMAKAIHDSMECTLGMAATVTMWKRDQYLSQFKRAIPEEILRSLKQEPVGQAQLFSDAGLAKATEFLIKDQPHAETRQLINAIKYQKPAAPQKQQQYKPQGSSGGSGGQQQQQQTTSWRGRGRGNRGGGRGGSSQRGRFRDDKGDKQPSSYDSNKGSYKGKGGGSGGSGRSGGSRHQKKDHS
jgi:hypothetical protein